MITYIKKDQNQVVEIIKKKKIKIEDYIFIFKYDNLNYKLLKNKRTKFIFKANFFLNNII